MSRSDAEKMNLGRVLDYCIEYNNMHEVKDEEEEKPKARKATQKDIDAFFGG